MCIFCVYSTTWDEHVFEITLPRSCFIGHVDLKFSLHTPCPSPPHIQVTLLKQNASGIGRKEKIFAPSVDEQIDFNINMQFDGSTKGIVKPLLSFEWKYILNVFYSSSLLWCRGRVTALQATSPGLIPGTVGILNFSVGLELFEMMEWNLIR